VILALAAIVSAPPLPVADMRQGMLDGDALAEFGQEAFIGVETDAAPTRTRAPVE